MAGRDLHTESMLFYSYGRSHAMLIKKTIKNQIVIPKALLKQANLEDKEIPFFDIQYKGGGRYQCFYLHFSVAWPKQCVGASASFQTGGTASLWRDTKGIF